MDLVSTVDIGLALGIVLAGSLVQASTGLGAGVIVVPLLILVNPVFVPGPVIFSSMCLTSTMAYQGRKEFHFQELHFILFGIFLGTITGISLVSIINKSTLGIFFGVFILIAVFVSAKGITVSMNRKNKMISGALSGFMGSTVGIGAPMLALLYQKEPGNRLRPILAYLFLVASIMMLSLMAIAGQFDGPRVWLGITLSPAMLMGYLLSSRIVRFMDKGRIRNVILIISVLSAVIIIWRSI